MIIKDKRVVKLGELCINCVGRTPPIIFYIIFHQQHLSPEEFRPCRYINKEHADSQVLVGKHPPHPHIVVAQPSRFFPLYPI